MTGAREMTMYCAVCGGPIFEPGTYEAPSWLSSAILLKGDGEQVPSSTSDVTIIPATNQGGPYFSINLIGTEEEVVACDVSIQSPFVSPKPPLYIPLHARCLTILRRVAETRSIEMQDTSISAAWPVLHAQYISACRGKRVPPTRFYVPSGYYGISIFRELVWEPGQEGSALNHEAQYFEADPLEAADWSTEILQNLDILSANHRPSDEGAEEAKVSDQMIHAVRAQLRSSDGPAIGCEYTIPAAHWKYAIAQGLVLPWGPKLNVNNDTPMDVGNESEMDSCDWEKLVRRLSAMPFRSGPLDMERQGLNIPMGLWNRRRIWQLVEDIFVEAEELT